MITPSGEVSLLAGNGVSASRDGVATLASFNNPYAMAIDAHGSIFVTEYNANTIRFIAAELPPPTHLGLQAAHSVPSSTFVASMAAMFDDPTQADVTFLVGDTQITAHKAIICAQSEYFRAMLLGNFQESHPRAAKRHKAPNGGGDGPSVPSSSSTTQASGGSLVAIRETTPTAFRAILRYLYTDEPAFDDVDVVQIMRKAREIQLDRVYALCLRHCTERLSPFNAANWVMQASEFDLGELRSAALAYLSRNVRRVRDEAPGSLQVLSREVLIEILTHI